MAASLYSDSRSGHSAVAQINITPLVDVMLVLLVIFMMAAPVIGKPMNLTLPNATPGERSKPPHVSLQVTAAGEFVLAGEVIEARALTEALRQIAAHAPHTVLDIDASADGDYQAFASALAAARNSGLQNIAMPR